MVLYDRCSPSFTVAGLKFLRVAASLYGLRPSAPRECGWKWAAWEGGAQSAREKGGARRGAVSVDVVVHELDALGVELVEVRRDDVRVVEARRVCGRPHQPAAHQSVRVGCVGTGKREADCIPNRLSGRRPGGAAC